MILVDANLLIYAHVKSFPQHEQARSWLDARLNGDDPVGLPWPCLLAFLRITTNPKMFERPEPISAAWSQVESWLSAERVWIPSPTARHQEILGRLLSGSKIRGNLVQDVHLAAISIEHGLTLCSTDADFAKFIGVRWINPIA